MGTGSSGGNATDGNDITSPRPFADDEDEIENYTHKSIYGGDGGHYKNEPAFNNPNRQKMGMYELKKFIKKILKEQAYGHATLTTQGSPRTGTIVPTDEYPFSARPKRTATGMMEQETDILTTAEEMYGIAAKEEFGKIHLYPGYTPERKDLVSYRTNKMYIVVKEDLQTVKFVSVQGIVSSEFYKILSNFGFTTSGEGSQFSGVTFYRTANDSGIKMNLEEMTQLIEMMEEARSKEADAQSSYYTREPGRGGTGIEEELTDKEEKKLKKIEKELNKASKMHKGQANRIGKIINEQSIEDLARKDIEYDRGKAKNAIKRIEIQRQEAMDAANVAKGQGSQAISQQEEQLAELNIQITAKNQEYTNNKKELKESTKRFQEIPTEPEFEKEKTKLLERIYELKEIVQKNKEEINNLREQRNNLNKTKLDAISAQTSAPSVTKQFNDQLRDAKKALSQVGKGQVAEILLRQYKKERKNVNLMEQIDFYNEITRGSLKKFFEMFEAGDTNEEVIQHYAKNGIQIPESFISKVKKQFEQYKKLKLELGFTEQEAKDFKKSVVPKEETKKLSTKIFKK